VATFELKKSRMIGLVDRDSKSQLEFVNSILKYAFDIKIMRKNNDRDMFQIMTGAFKRDPVTGRWVIPATDLTV